MQIGILCPISQLQRFAEQSHYHLVLAHLVEKGGAYVDFYRKMAKRGDFITLDNSSFEVGDGKYSPEQLIDLANEVHAGEVMAPESFPDAEKSIALCREFLSKFYASGHRGNLGVFATAHGSTYLELKQCVGSYLKNPGVTTIGMSCRLDYSYEASDAPVSIWNESVRKAMVRVHAVSQLAPDIAASGKPVHLLGLNHPIELFFYTKQRNFSFIRSNDTSAPYVAGSNLMYLDRITYEKLPVALDFESTVKLTQLQTDYVDANIIFWRDAAR